MNVPTKNRYRIPPVWIGFAWTCIVLAWAPAVALADGSTPTVADFAKAIAFCSATFLPWALATQSLFRLCKRYPLGVGRNTSSVIALFVIGLAVVPLLTLVAPLIQTSLALFSKSLFGPSQSFAELTRRIVVTSLFAVPTYVAVIAVGQTLVWAERARQQQIRSAQAELRALRSELSPHFLMNVLGSISQLAHASADRAEAALSALANVLRSSLAADEEVHTLADELGAVDEHLMLYRELNGKLDYRREVGDGLWQRLVPSRILIPLVENALTHGNLVSDGTRQVELTVTAISHGLRIEIKNPAPKVTRNSGGLGSGLDHVRQRLTILYQDRFHMTAGRDDAQFIVVIEIPHA